jgi:hypothetical protein
MPFAGIAAWFVLSAVAGKPMADTPFHGDPLTLALPFLGPAAVFGFLVMLYLAAAGIAQPRRLADAALAASVLAMVALAVNLRWAVFANVFYGVGHSAVGWLSGAQWCTANVLVPVAWLVFLVTFVRWPAPPLARGCCRAAGWLGLVSAVAGLWPVLIFASALGFFCLEFPSRGLPSFNAWMEVVRTFIEASRGVLLCVFALAVWRMRPGTEPPAGA